MDEKQHVPNVSHFHSSKTISSSIEVISKILKLLFEYFDRCTIQECRLVCSIWKRVIDKVIGLSVTINEEEYGIENSAFGRKVLIRKLRIQNLDKLTKFLSLKSPDKLETLLVIGPVQGSWIKQKVLGMASFLRKLEFSGSYLYTSNDLNFALKEHKKCRIEHTVQILPSLNELVISLDIKDVETYLEHSIGSGTLQVLWTTIFATQFQALYLLRKIVDRNVSNILEHVRSSALKKLSINVEAMKIIEKDSLEITWPFLWKIEPLRIFLEFHRLAIEKLYLPNLDEASNSTEDASLMLPTKLKTIEVSFLQKGNRSSPGEFEKCLFNQSQLEEIRLTKNYVGCKLFQSPSMGPLIRNSENTLKFLHLTLCSIDRTLLDGRTYRTCSTLHTFIVEPHIPKEFDNSRLQPQFLNISELPTSLKQLRIYSDVNLLSNDTLKHHSQLETVILTSLRIHLSSCETDFTRFVKEILHLRFLNRLHLQVEAHEPHEQNGQDMLLPLLLELNGNSKLNSSPFSYLKIFSKCWRLEDVSNWLQLDPFQRNSNLHQVIPISALKSIGSSGIDNEDFIVESNVLTPISSVDDPPNSEIHSVLFSFFE